MQLQNESFLQGGKYSIVQELGHGGFGITYQAYQVNRYDGQSIRPVLE